jgi:PAS domain S-box-containing protein
VSETFFAEMKRYMRFGPEDEAALRALAPLARPHFARIADEFYQRLDEHEEARAVFTGIDQVRRLQRTLQDWMLLLLTGPWDDEYYEKRARIGRMHVKIALPQRYMFGAMHLIRLALVRIVQAEYEEDDQRRVQSVLALGKILDLELAIMLETYREAFVEKMQAIERVEKQHLENRLAISEARAEQIVESAEALITTFAADGTLLSCNRRCEEILHVRRVEVEGRNFFDVFIVEDDHQDVERRAHEALASHRSAPYEGPIAFRSGNTGRRVRWHFTTLPSASGALVCAIGLDVTEAHEMAIRARRIERLASLGTMAAGLAHEIRNPLNAAHLQLTLLQRRMSRTPPDLEASRAAAELVGSEMKRLAALVQEFLQFARPQPLRLSNANLRATAEEIVALVEPEASTAGVELSFTPGQAIVSVYDEERVKQVLLNLLRNALEAAGRGGHVRVSVGVHDEAACLEVADTGPGIPADAPVFEPFFTTKVGGTGLGLAIVHRIVTDHGGRITYTSRPGETVFHVCLPLAGA